MKNDQPAFPTIDANRPEDYGTAGMTLRDYFATAAMSGFLSTDYFRGMPFNLVAEDAYRVADAMMEARK